MARTETALTEEQMQAAYERLRESTGNATLRPIDLLGMARDPETALSDRIDALTVVEYMRGLLDNAEHYLLDSARANGATWGALGEALGVTRQGAERRLLRGEVSAASLDGGRSADAGRKGRRITKPGRDRQEDDTEVDMSHRIRPGWVLRRQGAATDHTWLVVHQGQVRGRVQRYRPRDGGLSRGWEALSGPGGAQGFVRRPATNEGKFGRRSSFLWRSRDLAAWGIATNPAHAEPNPDWAHRKQ